MNPLFHRSCKPAPKIIYDDIRLYTIIESKEIVNGVPTIVNYKEIEPLFPIDISISANDISIGALLDTGISPSEITTPYIQNTPDVIISKTEEFLKSQITTDTSN